MRGRCACLRAPGAAPARRPSRPRCRRRPHRAQAAAAEASGARAPAKVEPPAPHFDHRAACAADDAFAAERWPTLAPLLCAGTLHCVRRADLSGGEYRERRADGYLEPEVVLVLGTSHLSEQRCGAA